MKVVILAGGFGTRLSEETTLIPKPMVEIGGKPILWHIMKIYSYHGFNDFVLCLGYKGYLIKEYFVNFFYHQSDIRVDLSSGQIEVCNSCSEPWKVTLVDTGLNTMTGGRIKRIQKYTEGETFMLTYGDGVADIHIGELLEFHRRHKKKATITVVQPPGRFGSVEMNNDGVVTRFVEKPKGDGGWINGGFFILEPGIFEYLTGDETIWEKEPLEKLSREGELVAYKHMGFWKAMDTLRDKNELEQLWKEGKALWKVWE